MKTSASVLATVALAASSTSARVLKRDVTSVTVQGNGKPPLDRACGAAVTDVSQHSLQATIDSIFVGLIINLVGHPMLQTRLQMWQDASETYQSFRNWVSTPSESTL